MEATKGKQWRLFVSETEGLEIAAGTEETCVRNFHLEAGPAFPFIVTLSEEHSHKYQKISPSEVQRVRMNGCFRVHT